MKPKQFEFGPFRLDAAEHLLLREEEPIQLPPKAFEMLLLLVENSGHVLQKNELIEALWPDSFVAETNLTQNIFLLRKALGDERGTSRFIKTVPRVGYRFVAPVRIALDEGDAVVVESHTRERIVIKEEIVEHEIETEDIQSIPLSMRILSLPKKVRIGASIVTASVVLLGVVIAFSYWARSGTITRGATEARATTEAKEAYRNGRALWNKRTSAATFSSTQQFELAIQKDPNFALGYEGLADAYAFDIGHWHEAEALAKKALTLDASLGEPHATLGFIRSFWQWDWKSGEQEFKESLRLNPNYATAHQWYAIHLALSGRAVEGEVEMKRALALQPESAVMNADMGQVFYFNRKYDEAIAACKKSLELDPGFFNAHRYLSEIYSANGSYDKAFEEALMVGKTSGAAVTGFTEAALKAYQNGGIKGFWQWRLQELIRIKGGNYDLAEIYVRLGEKEKAISSLEKAWQAHEFNVMFMSADPVFLDLHSDPRYVELRTRICPFTESAKLDRN